MSDAPRRRRPALRRDSEGRLQAASDWDTLVERQILETIDDGRFDDLPHRGEPLPTDDHPYARDRWLAFHVLRNAGVAPPWIEADKEVRELLARRDGLLARAAAGQAPSAVARRHDRTALEELIVRVNAAIARLNAEAPTERQHRRPLRLAAELARYDEACRR
jgi:DnaJ family protein C protein 28